MLGQASPQAAAGGRAARLPVVLDLLLDLRHHRVLGFGQGAPDVLPVSQARLCSRQGQGRERCARDLLSLDGVGGAEMAAYDSCSREAHSLPPSLLTNPWGLAPAALGTFSSLEPWAVLL